MIVEFARLEGGGPAQTCSQFCGLGELSAVILEWEGFHEIWDAVAGRRCRGGDGADEEAVVFLCGCARLLMACPMGFLTFCAAVIGSFAARAAEIAGFRAASR